MFNKEAQLDSSPIWNMPKIELDTYGHIVARISLKYLKSFECTDGRTHFCFHSP